LHYGDIYRHDDTIAALATPPGYSGIMVIRISGEGSIGLLSDIFKGKTSPKRFEDRKFYFGQLVDPATAKTLDNVLAVHMKGPHSYTGEDVVELHCHGNMVLAEEILKILEDRGARGAREGEFTYRAYLNGRMDLTQAEAVDALIRSKSRAGIHAAVMHLEGAFSNKMEEIRENIVDILTHLEVSLDFAEEDLEIYSKEKMHERVNTMNETVRDLIQSVLFGRIARDGIRVPIVGKSNVGKSSLLNMLVQEEKAIVTEHPGTTRDTVEEWIEIENNTVRLIDTAGLRTSGDPVEREGIKRTQHAIERADAVIHVVDGSLPLDDEDMKIKALTRGRTALVAVNKIDLPRVVSDKEVAMKFPCCDVVKISAKFHRGAKELHNCLARFLREEFRCEREAVCVWNARHYGILQAMAECLERAKKGIREELSEECIAIELREALGLIGDLTGESTHEDVLQRIFQTFCIGK
jgi:tRNA modification GTPase